jgi:hypothetical protein
MLQKLSGKCVYKKSVYNIELMIQLKNITNWLYMFNKGMNIH